MIKDRVDVKTAEEFVEKIDEGYDFSFIYIPKTERQKLRLLAKERYDREKTPLNEYLFARTIFTFDNIKDRFPLAKELLLDACNKDFKLAIYDVASAYLEGHYNFEVDYDLSYKYMKKASDLGFIPATFELSNYYLEGVGVKVDISEGIRLISLAAEDDYPAAIGTLGSIYFDGIYVQKDEEKAFDLFNHGASLGDVISYYSLGRMYTFGNGVDVDYNKAYRYLSKAYDEGFVPSFSLIAQLYLEGNGVSKSVTRGIKFLEEGVQSDDERSICMLGDIYIEGKIVPTDYSKAYDLFSRGVELDVTYAKHQLALMYYDGLYVKKDYKKAFNLLKEAASEGYIPSYYFLGGCYLTGRGTRPNEKKSFDCYKIAYENNVVGAAYMMARAYDYGLGTKADEKKMVKAYKKSIEEKDPFGSYYYAIYLKNKDYEKHKEEVDRLIKFAADDGLPDAQYSYAISLKNKGDNELYLQYLNLAATCGSADAFAELGHTYFDGSIVPTDKKKALNYFIRGAKLGSQVAALAAGIIYEEGIDTKPSLEEAMKYYNLVDGTIGNYETLIEIVSYLQNGKTLESENEKQAFLILKNMLNRDDIKTPYFELGRCYEHGLGVKVNYEKAIKYYLKEAEIEGDKTGFPAVANIFIKHYPELKHPDSILSIMMASSSVNKAAKYALGMMIFYSTYEEKSQTLVDLFEDSKDEMPDAYYYLSELEEDDLKSVLYLKEGTEHKSILCGLEIAKLCYGEDRFEESNRILVNMGEHHMKDSFDIPIELGSHYFDGHLEEGFLPLVIDGLKYHRYDEFAMLFLSYIYFCRFSDLDRAISCLKRFVGKVEDCTFSYKLYSFLLLARRRNNNRKEIIRLLVTLTLPSDHPFYLDTFLYGIIMYGFDLMDEKKVHEILLRFCPYEEEVDGFIKLMDHFKEDGFKEHDFSKIFDDQFIVETLNYLVPFIFTNRHLKEGVERILEFNSCW